MAQHTVHIRKALSNVNCERCAVNCRRPRAFTLIELVIVTILIAVLIGLIAPRMIDSGRRQAEFETAEITRLLGVAARRAALSGEIVAVEYDGSVPRLSLVALRETETSRGRRRTWVEDPLVPAVELNYVDILTASADGQTIGTAGSKWWVDFNPSEPRPALWLLVGRPRSDSTNQWQVELLPEETSASRRSSSQPSRASAAGALRVDLDAINQGERAW
jgi:prepilin-type N-terminal cleavage/methylation domain-containing protein